MSVLTILGSLFIGPLKLVFEIIFVVSHRVIGHPGLAIIVLSLIMNFLVLPLYRRADAMQEEARDIEARLHDGVAHIKKTFSGDERMMMLQTYYRQNNYKPADALNGSVSLLLEIPFFIAAYQFLSHLPVLIGVPLGPIADLSAPDRLLAIGGATVNLLPVLMTLINVLSGALYLKGFPLKAKVQLYGMALFFLVFLYNSPAGLVFYWTLNNIFSLAKNIFYKLKEPLKALCVLVSAAGLMFLAFGIFVYRPETIKRKILVLGIAILLQLPVICLLLKDKLMPLLFGRLPQPSRRFFTLGCLFLTILVGTLIPSAVIAASPLEFVDITYFHHPLWYIARSLCTAAGAFLVWLGVFYWLADARWKVVFERLVWAACGVMLVDYMFFGTRLGIINAALKYEGGVEFPLSEQLFNLAIVAVAALVMYIFAVKRPGAAMTVLTAAVVAIGGMSAMNVVSIKGSVDEILDLDMERYQLPELTLSKTGKNVVVLMLDRAMGQYVSYMIKERPELKEKFDGFTYYANTISHGQSTNMGSPGLFGGYEYTPVEMNRRNTEPLVKKHNEALLLMPVLFLQNGFDVTVSDPILANYKWTPDLSLYDQYPEIKTGVTYGKFTDDQQKQMEIDNNYRNFFCFGVMKTMPLFIQPTIYNAASYNQNADFAFVQMTYDLSSAQGVNAYFKKSYHVLKNLSTITKAKDEEKNNLILLANDTPHYPMILQTPDYVISDTVDNARYDAENKDRFVVDGKELKITNTDQMGHYHANMASMIQLGSWFDYLRENDVYDNTRIILAADHGASLWQQPELIIKFEGGITKDVASHYPLLMVKDFDAGGFVTSEQFMTNADVPTLATQGLIANPTNLFTGKAINSDEKTAHPQYLLSASAGERDWDVAKNNGNTFRAASWITIEDSIWDKDNWSYISQKVVLSEHAHP